ncbi:tetratricopeptide repeat protein [Thermovibrio sp.]
MFKSIIGGLLVALLLISNSYSLTYQDIASAYHRSFIYEKSGDYKDAIKALMPVYQAFPNGYTVNLRLGWLYYLLKKYSNSEFHYKKALKAIPTSLEPLLGLTLPYMAQGRWQDTEFTCYRILKSDYYNYYGNLRLSYAFRMEGKFSLAEAVDRKMLTIYPSDVNFLLELALSLYGEKKYALSESILKDVLILDPENSTAKFYLKKVSKLLEGENKRD